MKYSKKKSTPKKPLMLIAIPALVLLLGGALFFANNRNQDQKNEVSTVDQTEGEKIDFSPPTDAEKQQVEENKVNDGREPNPNPPAPPAESSVKISQASYDSAGQKLVVQTQLFGTGWLQCTLEVTQGASKVVKTAAPLYQPDFSTCLGFSVSSAEFPTGGEWNVLVKVTNKDGKVYSSNQAKVTITK